MRRGRAVWRSALPPRRVSSRQPCSRLGGAHESVRRGGWIFEQGKDAQGIAFRELQPFRLGDIRFRLWQRRAENVSGQIKPLDRGGARQRRFVLGAKPKFDAAVIGNSAGHGTSKYLW